MTESIDCTLIPDIGKAVPQEGGSFQLVPDNPCTSGDKGRFEEELLAALAFSKEHDDAPVWWMHNGIRVSTDDENYGNGAWSRYTELHGETGN